MSKYLWIIDAGHGGINPDGEYTTGNNKRYKFNDGTQIYEGVVNRLIAARLEKLLESKGIDYEKVYHDYKDTPLSERTNLELGFNQAEKSVNRNTIYLSIHSNAASNDIEGEGKKGRGFEIYTSKGFTDSDIIAEIFAQHYKEDFPEFPFRADCVDGDSDKEADFWVLRKTRGAAVLVENLFYDNIDEAKFLLSDEGQNRIANCLFKSIEDIELTKPI